MSIFVSDFMSNKPIFEMNKKNFIKVTAKGQDPVVVLATNEAFYRSQGFEVEEPSESEIVEHFPEYKTDKTSKQSDKTLKDEIKDLKDQLVKAEAAITDYQSQIKELKAGNEDLSGKLVAAEAKVKELEVKP